MSQSQNQFALSTEVGMIDMRLDYNTVPVQIDASQATPLLPGAAVKMVDSADGTPKVVACAADTDSCIGFINYDIKSKQFAAGDRAEISMAGNVVYLMPTGAVARGAQVTLDLAVTGGVKAAVTGKTIVGWAFDKCVSGTPARIFVRAPSFTLAP